MIYQNSNNPIVGSKAYMKRRHLIVDRLCEQFPVFAERKKNGEPVLPFISVDESDPASIKEARKIGMRRIDMLTTNPSYLLKVQKKRLEKAKAKGEKPANLDRFDILRELFETNPTIPISVEVNETTVQGMVDEARMIRDKLSNPPNLVIKVPASGDKLESPWTGVDAIARLREEKFFVNCTAIFNPGQALLTAMAGATFVSVFISRNPKYDQIPPLFDYIQTVELFVAQQIAVPIIAASLHDAKTAVDLLINGGDGITAMVSDVWQAMLFGLRNNSCLDDFLASYQETLKLEKEL